MMFLSTVEEQLLLSEKTTSVNEREFQIEAFAYYINFYNSTSHISVLLLINLIIEKYKFWPEYGMEL